MVSRNTTLVPSLGLCMGQTVQQASVLACEVSVFHLKGERKKKERMRVAMMTEMG